MTHPSRSRPHVRLASPRLPLAVAGSRASVQIHVPRRRYLFDLRLAEQTIRIARGSNESNILLLHEPSRRSRYFRSMSAFRKRTWCIASQCRSTGGGTPAARTSLAVKRCRSVTVGPNTSCREMVSSDASTRQMLSERHFNAALPRLGLGRWRWAGFLVSLRLQ